MDMEFRIGQVLFNVVHGNIKYAYPDKKVTVWRGIKIHPTVFLAFRKSLAVHSIPLSPSMVLSDPFVYRTGMCLQCRLVVNSSAYAHA